MREWHKMTYNEYGKEKVFENRKKSYTLLFNPQVSFQPYVVAYAYDEEDGTWGQGHYFSTFDEAVVFMYS